MHPTRRSSLLGLLPALLLTGCLIDRDLYERRREELLADSDDTDPEDTDLPVDADGDGTPAGEDCDDDDATVFPGATDVPYDGVDQDCADGDLADVDGDGFDAVTAGGDDCADDDEDVFPEAEETWANGVTDNDCDGVREGVRLEYGADSWGGWRERDGLGRRVVGLGDLDGDGLVEVGVGSEIESTLGAGSGALYRLAGPAGGDIEGSASLLPDTPGQSFASSLDGGVDVSGDSVPDLLISASGTASTVGAAWLVDGAAWRDAGSASVGDVALGQVNGTAIGGFAPTSVRFLGDVTGDGLDDLALGDCCWSPSGIGSTGRLLLFSSATFEGTLDDADVTIEGPWEGAYAAFEADRLGDQDEDGIDDLVVSATGGLVAAVLPGTRSGALADLALTMIYGEPTNGTVARNVSDVDADGRDDLALVGDDASVYFYTALAGSPVRLLDTPTFLFTWEEIGGVGDLVPLGDLDGDDRGEVLIPLAWSEAGIQRAWLLLGDQVEFGGSLSSAETTIDAVSVVPTALFGFRADLAGGDVDGDGQDDIVLGAPDYARGVVGAGGATLIPVPR